MVKRKKVELDEYGEGQVPIKLVLEVGQYPRGIPRIQPGSHQLRSHPCPAVLNS